MSIYLINRFASIEMPTLNCNLGLLFNVKKSQHDPANWLQSNVIYLIDKFNQNGSPEFVDEEKI